MKTVLIYEHVTGPMVWDTSTEESRNQAFLDLFEFLSDDVNTRYFKDLDVAESQLFNMAKRGAAKFARALLILKEIPLKEATVRLQAPTRKYVEVAVPEAVSDSNLPDLTNVSR